MADLTVTGSKRTDTVDSLGTCRGGGGGGAMNYKLPTASFNCAYKYFSSCCVHLGVDQFARFPESPAFGF